MSDYISKSALLERFRKDNRYSRHGFVSENYIDCLIKEFPTVDEKEIIRKAFERVVERLESNAQKMSEAKAIRPYAKHSPADHRYYKAISVKKAIEIVKEECGISE